MCLYVGTDVVLANLLRYCSNSAMGISFSDIEKYCERIKNEINSLDNGTKYISFQIYDRSLENTINIHSKHFKKINKKYYKGLDFNINEFSWKIKPELSIVLENIAKEFNIGE